jgi:hypothetical protein
VALFLFYGSDYDVLRGLTMRPALLIALLIPPHLHAQPKAKQAAAPRACALLSRAEFEKVTGRNAYVDSEELDSGGRSICEFGLGQLMIYAGANPEVAWESTLKTFGHDKAIRTPIAGLGDSAYSFTTKPRDANEDANAFVVVRTGGKLLALSVAAPTGRPPEASLPQALVLAKSAVARLR